MGKCGAIALSKTMQIVADCWLEAEDSLQHEIRKYSPDLDEESVTRHFHSIYARLVDEASNAGKIARAFREDLRKVFPNADKLHPSGLVAKVTLHGKQTEGRKTGGDIGVVVVRPKIQVHPQRVKIEAHKRGLLAQAKMFGKNGKWGDLTDNQKGFLPQRHEYASLLLYRYADTNRRSLERFQWQLCRGYSLDDVESWLKQDQFPTLTRSDMIIRGLGTGTVGTGNDKIIAQIIAPAHNVSLRIDIHWKDGTDPGSTVYVQSDIEEDEDGQVHVSVGL